LGKAKTNQREFMKMKKHFIIIFLFLFSMQAYDFSIALTRSIDNDIEKLVDSDSLANQDIEYKLKLKKIESEIKKLQAEIENLNISNRALGPTTRWISTILGTIGGLAGALIGLFIWLLGRSLSNKITKTQDAKLLQDKELNREQHYLELFKSLGDENPRTQLAAASVLVQRLMYFRKQKRSNLLSETEQLELPTIIHVLIAVTKEKISDRTKELTLNKYIADNLVIALDAIVPINQEPDKNKPSPLHNIDFQKSRLVNVWWKRIDARYVDFFEADLCKAGLAEAFLMNAVFFQSSLEECVLRKANLEGANLRNSNLKGADLSGANLSGTMLEGAKYNSKTKWPQNFDPKIMGAILE